MLGYIGLRFHLFFLFPVSEAFGTVSCPHTASGGTLAWVEYLFSDRGCPRWRGRQQVQAYRVGAGLGSVGDALLL